MNNHNINNFRNSISDYPKLHEWEAKFIGLPGPVSTILGDQSITDNAGNTIALLSVLMDTNKIPGLSVGLIDNVYYKGAKASYGSRLKLDGTDLDLSFKEIKGATQAESWIIRRSMKAWCHTIDDYFGNQAPLLVHEYKATLELSMQDETGSNFYKIRYFGVKPIVLKPVPLTYASSTTYPLCEMTFSYDYWRDQYDDNFGQGV